MKHANFEYDTFSLMNLRYTLFTCHKKQTNFKNIGLADWPATKWDN